MQDLVWVAYPLAAHEEGAVGGVAALCSIGSGTDSRISNTRHGCCIACRGLAVGLCVVLILGEDLASLHQQGAG